ncbi:MAG: cobalamin biosynthesis protein [Thermoplasmataceae archaeon]
MLVIFLSVVLAVAIAMDLLFGEPPEAIHPVVYFGKVISVLDPLLRKIRPKTLSGGAFLVLVALIGLAPFVIILHFSRIFILLDIFVSAYLLKSTFAIRSMIDHINRVLAPLELGNMDEAKSELAMLVRRPVDNLSEGEICSACVESMSEGLVDGFIGPLFYYPFFGVLGSLFYRIINTLDSNVGYKDRKNIKFGKASAVADSALNYIPARFSSLVITVSAALLSLKGFLPHLSDIATTDSPNAGWPMSTAASFLNVRLEKVGHYVINEEKPFPSIKDVRTSIKLYVISCAVFVFLWVLPAMAIMSVIGGL